MTAPFSDRVRMNSEWIPCPARPRKLGDPRSWEVLTGYGFDSAYTTYKGGPPPKFEIEVVAWLDSHFEEWEKFAKKVLPKPTGRTTSDYRAISIYHPILRVAPHNVTHVIVEDVSQWDVNAEGLWTCSIAVMVFRAPRPVLKQPTAGIPSATLPTPTAKDAADVKINELVDQVDELL